MALRFSAAIFFVERVRSKDGNKRLAADRLQHLGGDDWSPNKMTSHPADTVPTAHDLANGIEHSADMDKLFGLYSQAATLQGNTV